MKFRIAAEQFNALPEAIKALYKVQGDGSYQLDVEGVVPKETLDDFRNNNITLLKEKEELQKKFGNVDLDQYTALMTEHQKNKDKKLIDAGKIDELVEERVQAMKKTLEQDRDDYKGKFEKASGRLSTLLIDNAVQTSAVKAGVRKTAIEDVLLRARGLFKVEEDKVVPYKDGKPVFGKNGTDHLTIDEYVTSLLPDAPHLFESSAGGGAHNEGGNQLRTGSVSKADFAAGNVSLEDVASGKVTVAE